MFSRLRLRLACRVLSALAASALVFSVAHQAHASSGTAIGVDLDYAHGINEPGVGSGTGFNVRLGYKLDLLLAQLTPEVGGGYHTFSGDANAKFSQGFVGGRLAFGKILEPGLYAHIGYGHVAEDFVVSTGAGTVASTSSISAGRSGATADAGVTLDLTLLPLVDLGVHAGYDGMLKSGDYPAFDSYVLGVHAAVVF